MADDMLPKDISLQGIHTLQTDMAEAVNKNNISQASLIVEKQAQKEEQLKVQKKATIEERISEDTPTATPSHLIRNVFIVLITLGIVGGSAYGILKIAKKEIQEAPVSTAPIEQPQTIVTYDFLKEVAFASVLSREVSAEGDGITFYKTNRPASDLLYLLSPSVPAEFIRSLGTRDFFGGTGQGNFLILKVDSYDQAFGTSFVWETSMGSDLLPLFNVAASSTKPTFEDIVIANKDVRVAKSSEDKTLFLYGFYDPKTLVFARNEQLLRRVYEMLQRSDL